MIYLIYLKKKMAKKMKKVRNTGKEGSLKADRGVERAGGSDGC